MAKEKKQERLLQEELEKTRADLNSESTQRIKQEYELKELRQAREELTAQVRKLSAQGMQLERSLADALKENKNFREENVELKKKKEGEAWVAKSDYKRLEGILKRARWEVEQFKKKVPVPQWPRALQPKSAIPPRQDGESSSGHRPDRPAAVAPAAQPAQPFPVIESPKSEEGQSLPADIAAAPPASGPNSSSQGV